MIDNHKEETASQDPETFTLKNNIKEGYVH